MDYTPWTISPQAYKLVEMKSNFDNVCMQLGSRVIAFRKQAGISQEELAFRADIDRTYVSQIERGVCNPSLLVICKVSSVLGVQFMDLFENKSL